MTTLTTYALRLPKSLKAEAEKLSKADGTSLNQFVAIAVAQKISAHNTAAFFEERIARASKALAAGQKSALAEALTRPGGEPPRPGDEWDDPSLSATSKTRRTVRLPPVSTATSQMKSRRRKSP
jgi:hypothetical protein